MRAQPDHHTRTFLAGRSRRHVVVAAVAMAIAAGGIAGRAAAHAPQGGGGCESYERNRAYPLGLCDKGAAVKVIQSALRSYVDPTLEVDAYFGLRTEEAVRVFQTRSGLEVNGLVGPETWSPLTAGFASGFDGNGNGLVDPWEVGTTAPPAPQPQPVCATYRADYAYPIELCGEGEAIRIAQLALRDKVAPDLVADGYFGPKTLTAVRQFQHNNGLAVDGIIGQQTWTLLTDGYRWGYDENANGLVDPWEQGGEPPAAESAATPHQQLVAAVPAPAGGTVLERTAEKRVWSVPADLATVHGEWTAALDAAGYVIDSGYLLGAYPEHRGGVFEITDPATHVVVTGWVEDFGDGTIWVSVFVPYDA